MANRIYVGNLPFTAGEEDVKALFAQYGKVVSVNLINDRETGQPRGFGFVEMEEGEDDAIAALDGKEFGGRRLKVNIARPRDEGPRRR